MKQTRNERTEQSRVQQGGFRIQNDGQDTVGGFGLIEKGKEIGKHTAKNNNNNKDTLNILIVHMVA